VRHNSDIIFREEIFARAAKDPNVSIVVTVTREMPSDPRLRTGRIDDKLVADVFAMLGGEMPKRAYVCGANAFVDVASRLLLDMGVPFPAIKTERYGGDPAREGGVGQAVPEA
jgi:ferredoxin-NADP reductase